MSSMGVESHATGARRPKWVPLTGLKCKKCSVVVTDLLRTGLVSKSKGKTDEKDVINAYEAYIGMLFQAANRYHPGATLPVFGRKTYPRRLHHLFTTSLKFLNGFSLQPLHSPFTVTVQPVHRLSKAFLHVCASVGQKSG